MLVYSIVSNPDLLGIWVRDCLYIVVATIEYVPLISEISRTINFHMRESPRYTRLTFHHHGNMLSLFNY